MALLTGLTPEGQEVPVQVTPDGRLVAEGLTGSAGPEGPQGPVGPAGPKGDDKWATSGANINYTAGRVLVGTSSGSDNNALLKVQGNSGGSTGAGWIDIRRGLTTPGSGGQLGLLSFSDASGNLYAFIESYTDAAAGTNDYPGRLVFSTTADGASSPTERMRIKSTGVINFANVPTYADNAAATAGGLVAGDVYKKADGALMIAF